MCINGIIIGSELTACMQICIIEIIHASLCIRTVHKEYIVLTTVFLYRLTMAQT